VFTKRLPARIAEKSSAPIEPRVSGTRRSTIAQRARVVSASPTKSQWKPTPLSAPPAVAATANPRFTAQ